MRARFSAGSISRHANGFRPSAPYHRGSHQSVPEVPGSPCELAEDQTPIHPFGSDELLGHQVHPVMQGSHQAKVGGLVEWGEFPCDCGASSGTRWASNPWPGAPVDLSPPIPLGGQITVFLDMGPAGAPFHKGEHPW